MRPTLRLGRVAGIPIGINAGVLVILVLVCLGLAYGRLPVVYPGRPVPAYLLAGALAALAFVASLLAHELAHAVVAQRRGIEVEGITLWLLGGVARLRSEARTPRDEFAVAVVGPATSLLLGGVFIALTVLLDAAGVGGLPAAVTGYLGMINIVLGVFNLVPAAPLDGGRLLRAALWRSTGDRARAAVVAARAGRVFGLLLLGLGLVQVLFGNLGGLWLLLVGWFLAQAASGEAEHARWGQWLHGVRVGDVMTAAPRLSAPDRPVLAFIDDVVMRHAYSTYPLADPAGRFAGLVTLDDVRAVPPERRAYLTLGEIARPPDRVTTSRADEPLIDLLPRLSRYREGRAVVLDPDGRVIGIVAPGDVDRAITRAELRATYRYPPAGAGPDQPTTGGRDTTDQPPPPPE